MFPTLGQQFSPCFLVQILQHVQLLVESLGSPAYALGSKFGLLFFGWFARFHTSSPRAHSVKSHAGYGFRATG
jgi:hypothetical protein